MLPVSWGNDVPPGVREQETIRSGAPREGRERESAGVRCSREELGTAGAGAAGQQYRERGLPIPPGRESQGWELQVPGKREMEGRAAGLSGR